MNFKTLGESDCLIKTKPYDLPSWVFNIRWFLLSGMLVNMMQLIQALLNSGGNYDLLKVAKCLVG